MECVRYSEVPQRVAEKAIFCFKNKIQFQSNKICYKVASLCSKSRYESTIDSISKTVALQNSTDQEISEIIK